MHADMWKCRRVCIHKSYSHTEVSHAEIYLFKKNGSQPIKKSRNAL